MLREILILSSIESMTNDVDFVDKEAIGESIKYATIIATTLPVICTYPFLQKYFVKGIMIGVVKG